MRSPLFDSNPQDPGPQYLEDLATAYWFSEVLFAAVESRLFTLLEPSGKTIEEISAGLAFKREGLDRFLNALCVIGLLVRDGSRYFNSKISADYLVEGKEHYQGDSVLWRKDLIAHWSGLNDCLRAGGRTVRDSGEEDLSGLSKRRRKYINAMDCAAKMKVKEMLPLFEGITLQGEMLDVGAGSGAVSTGFLERFPSLKATLVDIPEVLEHTREFIDARGMEKRADLVALNILGPWPFERGRFDLVMLSNIIHAYSERELPHVLARSAACLKDGGLLIVHDFFFEHFPEKSALFDLNMFINTYNGRVFSDRYVAEELERLKLHVVCAPLGTDTEIMIASPMKEALAGLGLDKKTRLAARIRALGLRNVITIPAGSVHIPGWTDMRCRFGCGLFGKPHCPPHAPSADKTKEFIRDYSAALLLEGEPPTRDFQRLVLEAEKEAFKAGFYKAFAYWSGPCSLCASCADDGVCRNTEDARPSMEGAGIDVFETVKRAGLSLRTLPGKDDFVRYFGLILLE